MFNSYGMSECWFIPTCFVCCTRRHRIGVTQAYAKLMDNSVSSFFLPTKPMLVWHCSIQLLLFSDSSDLWDLYSDEANHHLPANFHWFYKDSTGWRAECFPLTCDLRSIGLISRAVPAILPANIVTRWVYPVIWTIHFLCEFCMLSVTPLYTIWPSGTYR
jgi:hypothetical protein